MSVPFNKRQLMDKLWGQLIAIGRELSIEQRECAKRKGMTTRYANLAADERKLKAEYERVKGLGTMDPLNVEHGTKMQSEKIVGDLMGRNGDDTHFGIGGDQDRRGS